MCLFSNLMQIFSIKPQIICTKIYPLLAIDILFSIFGSFQTHTCTIFTAILFNVHAMPIICTDGQMDGEAVWWTTSGNIRLSPPLASVMVDNNNQMEG